MSISRSTMLQTSSRSSRSQPRREQVFYVPTLERQSTADRSRAIDTCAVIGITRPIRARIGCALSSFSRAKRKRGQPSRLGCTSNRLSPHSASLSGSALTRASRASRAIRSRKSHATRAATRHRLRSGSSRQRGPPSNGCAHPGRSRARKSFLSSISWTDRAAQKPPYLLYGGNRTPAFPQTEAFCFWVKPRSDRRLERAFEGRLGR